MLKRLKNWAIYHRAAAKTFSWRVVASTDTFLLGFAVITLFDMPAAAVAGAIAGLEVATKLILYYTHERVWQKVPHPEAADEVSSSDVSN
jgi:uncharacterized membrane protein